MIHTVSHTWGQRDFGIRRWARREAQRGVVTGQKVERPRCVYCGITLHSNELRVDPLTCTYCSDLPGLDSYYQS